MQNISNKDDLQTQTIRNFFRIYPILKSHVLKLKRITRETDIQLPHAQILLVLSEHDALSVTQIARYTGIAMPNITPLIDRLCSLEYVVKKHNSNDKRMVEISILPEGRACIDRIMASVGKQVFGEDTNLTEHHLRELLHALRTIQKIFSIDSQ